MSARWLAPVALLGLCACPAEEPPSPAVPTCSLPAEDPVIVALDAGFDVTLAVTSDGNLWCWGEDNEGWCASGYLPYPTKREANLCLTSVAGGGSAGTRPDGTVELFDIVGPFISLPDPYRTSVAEAGVVVQVVADGGNIGFLDQEGAVRYLGSAGDDSNKRDFDGFERLEVPAPVRSLVRGFSPCVVGEDDTAYCLEVNDQGMPSHVLDEDLDNSTFKPVATPEPGGSVTLGWDQACELTLSGRVYCVGDYGKPFLPDGEPATTFELIPDLPEIDVLKASSVGATHCGLAAGDLWCWGGNGWDSIESMGDSNTWPPIQSSSFGNVVDFVVGHAHLCALLSDHQLWCRGWVGAKRICSDDFEWELVPFEACNELD